MQTALEYSSLLYYMTKPSHLLIQGFKENKKENEKLSKNMCNFGAWENWREGRRVVIYYLDIETTKYQCRLLNPTPLDCIIGYIIEDSVGDRALDSLPQRMLNLIDGSISSYCSILNSPK